MELTKLEDDPSMTHLRLSGRLDAAGADAVGIRFTAAVAASTLPAVIDFSGVDFIASMGLRLLVSTARALKQKGARMCLYGLRPEVREVFEDAGMTGLLDIAEDVAAARRHVSE